MYTDPIADMLNRIRTAQMVSKRVVDIPFSQEKYGIAECMEKAGFIENIAKKKKENLKYLRVHLKYDEKNEPRIQEIRRISSPGQRVYMKAKELKKVKGGTGISIISSSKGLITNKEAKEKNLGGEVLCEVW